MSKVTEINGDMKSILRESVGVEGIPNRAQFRAWLAAHVAEWKNPTTVHIGKAIGPGWTFEQCNPETASLLVCFVGDYPAAMFYAPAGDEHTAKGGFIIPRFSGSKWDSARLAWPAPVEPA